MPQPVSVWYNDWRQIDVAPFDAFRPTLPVSVIVSYYEARELLARTMAALEGQTYPRDLFEVVIVDDGSRVPLERPRSTPLTVKVVHQEDRGFGLARARNTGVRAATHDILVFLDGDMLPEAGWLMAHARWHHAASDILTFGFRVHVAVNDVSATMIRERTGSLENLFTGREVDLPWTEPHMSKTRQLTSRDDDPFKVMEGGNFGIGREFYALVGGFNESFTRWGLEDTEFAYRAYARGGVLVPVREAFAWHQSRWAENRERKLQSRHLQRAKAAHLIAHEDFRNARPGRIFTVPQYVVTIEAADLATDRILETTERVLADRVHDLVIRIEMREDDERLVWLGHQFGPDPRVRVGPMNSALDEFPSSAFHVTLPAGAAFARDVIHRLRRELGPSVAAMAVLSDGSQVTITRTWALHRARRTSQRVTDFGDVITIPARRLQTMKARLPDVGGDALRRRLRALSLRMQKVLGKMGRVRTFRQAWWFLEWVAGVVRGKVAKFAWTRSGRDG